MRVLYVDIDSLRPDHLGCYGYDRETSPTIDRVAEDGVRFENCYASDTPCMPSRSALATCRFGAKNGNVTHFGSGQWYDEPGSGHDQDPKRPLAFRYLSEAGIHTSTVTSFGKRHFAYHFPAGFRESIQPVTTTGAEDASDVTETAVNWLGNHATEDDWFLHVNYWDVHHPYDGIDEYVDDVVASGPGPDWPDQEAIDQQQQMTGTRCADCWPNPSEYETQGHQTGVYEERPMPTRFETRADVDRVLEGYDASIRKVDAALDRLLETLAEQGVREETAVVITADHGDALGEHGIYAEHAFAHPPCQRVPMIVSWPGVTDENHGSAVEGHVYQFDLLPTICEQAGIDVPGGWDGQSFLPALQGDSFDGRDYLVCSHGIYTFSRAVYCDEWVFIRLLHPGVFSYPGLYNDPDLAGGGLELLHNLERDPHMTENLIEEVPDVAASMRARLDRWNADVVASADASGEDPLARMAAESGPYLYVDPDALEALYETELDRTPEQVAAIQRRHDFPQPSR
jgi:arylsulfatase A-like enzyme